MYKGYTTPWQILSAIHLLESGRQKTQVKRSYAGARGPMQFLPSTFRHYCPGLNIDDLRDSITCADRYLQANYQASGSWRTAIWHYNHSNSYVWKVLNEAKIMGFNNNNYHG